jgi:hypothetical protein
MIPADVLVQIDSEVAVPSADGLVVAGAGIANYEGPLSESRKPARIKNNNSDARANRTTSTIATRSADKTKRHSYLIVSETKAQSPWPKR